MTNKFDRSLAAKLKEVRLALGISIGEAAARMKFNHYQTLSDIENGERKVRADELIEFSKIYYKELSFFLSSLSEIKSTEAPIVVWRNCSNDPSVKEREQEFLKYCYNYLELEKKLGLNYVYSLPLIKKLNADDFDYKMIADLALQFYKILNLGSRPACSLGKVLEEKCNIKILFLDIGKAGSAASTIGAFGAAILINSSEPSWRRNFDIAHELFHLITWDIFKHSEFHYNQETEEKPFIEKYADFFAACLLLPAEEVLCEFDLRQKNNRIDILDIVGIAKEFQVSTEALLWRLVGLRRLKKLDVKELLERDYVKKILEDRFKEDMAPPHLSHRYVNLAFKAYTKELISRGKLADYLVINRADVTVKLKEYGYAEGEAYDEQLAAA